MKTIRRINYEGVEFWHNYNWKFHREDGPALIYPDGSQFWYIDGEAIDCNDNEEFLRIMKLRVFFFKEAVHE